MWTPDLTLRPSLALLGLILASHGAVGWALWSLQGQFVWLIPLVVCSAVYFGLRDGLKWLPVSIERVWLDEGGWFWQQRNGVQQGPFPLHSLSRVDSYFIRLSFQRGLRLPSHLLLTAGMVGADPFRQLQVFLRWAGDKNQPLGR